jgi:hypothetical protein
MAHQFKKMLKQSTWTVTRVVNTFYGLSRARCCSGGGNSTGDPHATLV